MVDLSIIGILCLASFFFAALATFGLIHAAPHFSLLQYANARSSHTEPTPTGGGVSFAVAGLLAGFFISLMSASLVPYVLFTLILSLLGFLDDLFDLPAALRFVVQVVLTLLLFWHVGVFGGTGQIVNGYFTIPLLVGMFVASIWWLNLVNFMDGIDGLVATQACAIIIAGYFVTNLIFDQPMSHVEVWVIVTSFAVFGFLVFNLPPARIFMGDAGSYFIAALLLLQFLHTLMTRGELISMWLLLAAPLACDATTTLLVRLFGGEKWYAPHRQHLYQKLSRRWASHRAATLVYLACTLFVFLPLGVLSAFLPLFAPLFLFVGYAAGFVLCIVLGAGRQD
ncbi:hypothetical protein [Maritalea porphyrae]|uniref:Glycosyl transferase n=1 Tax=Maritalea porphyrae TaxID=880732 RepID=A0ABQ5USJ6_9HYPH|nr:hypothetical protein [Maritalea porphyrae]GLQ17627.1 glycosyl transferase [Maritalea porphyrae]